MKISGNLLAKLACMIAPAALCAVSPAAAHEVGDAHPHGPIADAPPPPKDARWLAGDHHVHSRFSVGYDAKTSPPTPLVGEDAAYPIPMNAVMARRFGLDWMVATDHGGPNHSKVHHDHAYPELLQSRQAVPELVQFFGMELNSPGADHSSIVIPPGPDEVNRLFSIETMFDSREAWPLDPERNKEPRMLEALKAMRAQSPRPVVIAHHPSRSATGLGEYGLTTPGELRDWNDTAPDVAIGMEGAPGHQAAALKRDRFGPEAGSGNAGEQGARGGYRRYPTMGGFDQMTARLGGFWDSMLGEGRRWWITATSDSHVNFMDGGSDFWPGEYSKTYVFAAKDHASIMAGLRAGRVFVTTGDLIDGLDFSARSGRASAMVGGTLKLAKPGPVRISIRIRDPKTLNANGDNPAVARIDLIRGKVSGPAAERTSDTNPTTRIEARFTPEKWRRSGDDILIDHVIADLNSDEYIRIRGTNGEELEPATDALGENPWADLWFYSNPIFVDLP